jgi:putative transposase
VFKINGPLHCAIPKVLNGIISVYIASVSNWSLIFRSSPVEESNAISSRALSVLVRINQTWSIDFTLLKGVLNRVSDSLSTGRKIRAFSVIDDCNRECLCIEVGRSLPAQRVIQSLEWLIEWRGKPKAIRCDNSPEYISHLLREWA